MQIMGNYHLLAWKAGVAEVLDFSYKFMGNQYEDARAEAWQQVTNLEEKGWIVTLNLICRSASLIYSTGGESDDDQK